MTMHLSAAAGAARVFNPRLAGPDAAFEVISEGRCGLEVRHQDGAIFAFTLNAAHTGLTDCRRPYEGADHELYRAAARRFAERRAHELGLIFCPKVA